MECHGSIGSVRPSSCVDTATRREQVDACLQTSLTLSHTSLVEPEQDADYAMMIVEHLDFESSSHRFQLTHLSTASRGRVPICDVD